MSLEKQWGSSEEEEEEEVDDDDETGLQRKEVPQWRRVMEG